MENVSLVGTPVENVVGEFEFPDGKKRLATKRTKMGSIVGETHYEYVEKTDRPMSVDGRITMSGKIFLTFVKAVIALLKVYKSSTAEFTMTIMNGLNLKVVDSAHVGMIDLFVPKEALIEFDMPEVPAVISLDADKLKDLKVKATDAVSMSMKFSLKEIKDKPDGDVYVHYGNYECTKIALRFGFVERSLVTIDESMVTVPKIPNMDFDSGVYVVVETSRLLDAINQCALVGDAVSFDLYSDHFEIRSHGGDEEAKVSIERDFIKDLKLVQPDNHAIYPVEYLQRILNAARSSEDMKLSFKRDYPMKAEFWMNVDSPERVGMYFYLAPRME